MQSSIPHSIQSFTRCCQLLDGLLGDMGHEAYDGKDDKAGKHAGAGVDAAHDDGVPKEREKGMCHQKKLEWKKKNINRDVDNVAARSYLYTSLL